MNIPTPSSHYAQPTARQRFGRKMLSQRGYSLIELSIALAILAVIIIGGLLGVQAILRNNRTNDMLKAVPVYMANATKVNASQPTITTTTFALADLGVFPAQNVSGNALARVVNHEHGGRIFVEANAAVSGSVPVGQSFVLTLAGIPQASCVDVASGLDGLALEIAVVAALVPPVTVTAIGAVGPVKAPGGAIGLAALAAACTVAGAKDIRAVIAR